MSNDPPDEVAAIARRFRIESVAALVAAIRDERAPASTRVAAAVKLLEYASGKPGQARPVTIADIDAMTRDQCVALLQACCNRLERNEPGLLWEIMGQTVERAGGPRTNRFTRGPASPLRPAHVPPPRADGAPKPPGAPPHRQPPPTPEPPPLPPAAQGNAKGNGANGFHGASLLLDDDEPDVRVIEVP